MLKALYDYAMKNNLVLPPGYSNKTIKAYVSLSKKGEFLGIILGDDTPVLCPDIGSLANGKEKCKYRNLYLKNIFSKAKKDKIIKAKDTDEVNMKGKCLLIRKL